MSVTGEAAGAADVEDLAFPAQYDGDEVGVTGEAAGGFGRDGGAIGEPRRGAVGGEATQQGVEVGRDDDRGPGAAAVGGGGALATTAQLDEGFGHQPAVAEMLGWLSRRPSAVAAKDLVGDVADGPRHGFEGLGVELAAQVAHAVGAFGEGEPCARSLFLLFVDAVVFGVLLSPRVERAAELLGRFGLGLLDQIGLGAGAGEGVGVVAGGRLAFGFAGRTAGGVADELGRVGLAVGADAGGSEVGDDGGLAVEE